jgi:hypothetical protein
VWTLGSHDALLVLCMVLCRSHVRKVWIVFFQTMAYMTVACMMVACMMVACVTVAYMTMTLSSMLSHTVSLQSQIANRTLLWDSIRGQQNLQLLLVLLVLLVLTVTVVLTVLTVVLVVLVTVVTVEMVVMVVMVTVTRWLHAYSSSELAIL